VLLPLILYKIVVYYSQIQIEPQHAITYNNSNTNKKVIYRTFVTNDYPPVAALGSFNQLINSGIVHPTGVLIVPFLAPVTGTNGGLGDSQWKSPFDTCPCTTFPNQFTSLCRWSKRFTIYSSIWL
jgi:hypothetical protein